MASLATSLFVLSRAAEAGYYSGPVYSGGDYKNPYNDPANPRVPDALVSGAGWGGSTGAGYGFSPGSNQSFSGAADCGNAPIKADFTWTHDNSSQTDQDDPPPPVIVTETTESGWSANGPGASAATGTFDNPYSFPPVTSPSGYGSSEKGIHYSTQPGAHTITVSADLTASASGPGSGPGSGVSTVSDYVNYTVSVVPVTINFSGTTLYQGLPAALTGQQIAATVNAPYSIDPTSYHWNVSGGMFKNYDWTLVSNQKSELADADYFQSAFTFYDATSEVLDIKSNVTVICPDGTRLMVNPEKYLNMFKPIETSWGISSTSLPDGGFYYDYLYTQNGPQYGPQYGVQVTWKPITMIIPSPFTGGQVCLAQYASLGRVATRVALNGASTTYVVSPASQGLDSGFPYVVAYQLDGNGNLVLDKDGNFRALSPPQWNINGSGPTEGAGGDSPFQLCEPPIVSGDTGGSDWRSSTSNDQFDTWTMYRPPVVGNHPTVWVPVQMIHWEWTGSASVHTEANGSVGLDNQGNPQWYFAPPKPDPAGSPSNTVMFPTWNMVIPYLPSAGPSTTH